MQTDCRDAGCPDGEECKDEMDEGSARHVCVCPDGFKRDNNTGQCQPVSKSGQYLGH